MVDTSTEAVEMLLDGVRPGPWEFDPRYITIVSGEKCIAEVFASDADALFMAASRDLVPALLAERDALKSERDRSEAALARACLVGGTTYLIERATKAEAEVEQLKAQPAQAGSQFVTQLHQEHFDAFAKAVERVECQPVQSVTVQDAAVSDVLAERARQISAEGWTPEHDDAHEAGELARAAACYAMQAALDNIGTPGLADATRHMVREMWPWSREWWKPADHRRDLVKAGALILAEIQRLDRAALRAIAEGKA